MQFHQLKRENANKKSRTIGRGGKRGKTSGRGGKGQTARAGHKMRPEIRDFIKRIPKLRGRGKNSNISFVEKNFPLSLNIIEKNFDEGATVSPEVLLGKKLIETRNGKVPRIKILGGTITKKILVSGCLISASAKSAVEKAGGKVA